ncbi:hypothetical protein FQZ97_1211480 [compost metagenome]
MERVTERDKAGGPRAPQIGLEPGEGQARIIGWQHLPATGETRHLFEMQVGNQKCLLVVPIERARG